MDARSVAWELRLNTSTGVGWTRGAGGGYIVEERVFADPLIIKCRVSPSDHQLSFHLLIACCKTFT